MCSVPRAKTRPSLRKSSVLKLPSVKRSSGPQNVNEIQSARADIQGVLKNQKQILQAVEQTERGISEIAAETDEQTSVAEEISSAVDDVSDRAQVVSEEITEIADENESQTEMVSRLTQEFEDIDRQLASVMDQSV